MFESRSDMEKGIMKHFGLLMHIGRDRGKLKTKALYIPAPGMITSNADRAKIGIDGTKVMSTSSGSPG
jgi:hypothetical protein